MLKSSDRSLLDLIRRSGPIDIGAMSEGLGVTATAIRNRLDRLQRSGMVVRTLETNGRGRPKHLYDVSHEAKKTLGQNYAELAVVLWDEMMRTVDDPKLRRFLFGRVTERLASLYRAKMTSELWESRLIELGTILHDRGIETEVSRRDDSLTLVLKQHSCPYQELAEVDRAVCAMERKMFEKVVGRGLRISQCRLDGYHSCDFEEKPVFKIDPAPSSANAS